MDIDTSSARPACGITLLCERYKLTFGSDYPLSDDSIFDVLEAYDTGPVTQMSNSEIYQVLSVMRQRASHVQRHVDMCEDSGLVFMLPSVLNTYAEGE